jgi:hypothetical protein
MRQEFFQNKRSFGQLDDFKRSFEELSGFLKLERLLMNDLGREYLKSRVRSWQLAEGQKKD